MPMPDRANRRGAPTINRATGAGGTITCLGVGLDRVAAVDAALSKALTRNG